MSKRDLGAEGAIRCKTSIAPRAGARCRTLIGSAPAPKPNHPRAEGAESKIANVAQGLAMSEGRGTR